MRIGMIRNAKDENKKDVLVYLSPFPHIRIDMQNPYRVGTSQNIIHLNGAGQDLVLQMQYLLSHTVDIAQLVVLSVISTLG